LKGIVLGNGFAGGGYIFLKGGEVAMGIVLWIIFGAIAGWIASVIMKTNSNQDTITDILMGVVGAVVGGYLMGLVGQSGVTGFDIRSLAVAVIGAVVVIYVVRMIRKR